MALAQELKLKCALKISSLVYLCLLLPLLPLQAPHPLTALANALLALPLGLCLIAGALLFALIPATGEFFSGFIALLESALSKLGGPLRSVDSLELTLWPYLVALLGLTLILPKRLKV